MMQARTMFNRHRSLPIALFIAPKNQSLKRKEKKQHPRSWIDAHRSCGSRGRGTNDRRHRVENDEAVDDAAEKKQTRSCLPGVRNAPSTHQRSRCVDALPSVHRSKCRHQKATTHTAKKCPRCRWTLTYQSLGARPPIADTQEKIKRKTRRPGIPLGGRAAHTTATWK